MCRVGKRKDCSVYVTVYNCQTLCPLGRFAPPPGETFCPSTGGAKFLGGMVEGHWEKEGLDLVGRFAPPHQRGAKRPKGQNVPLPSWKYFVIRVHLPKVYYIIMI